MERKKYIEKLCKSKEQKLQNKYLGNLVKVTANKLSEPIGDYTKDLFLKMGKEYLQYLKELWNEISSEKSKSLESILDNRHISMLMTDDNREGIHHAYVDATRLTLCERQINSKHKDVH